MKSAVVLLTTLACSTLYPASAAALDTFDRHTSYWVKQAAKKFDAVKELSSGQAGKLKGLSPQIISPCVVIKTGEGNWAKAIVNWGFRKGKKGLMPVLSIERYVTYDGDRGDVAIAQGKNLMLFEGFEFDFDIGQVVPAGEGSDVAFNKRLLVTLGEATLHGVNGSVLPPPEPGTHDPLADPKVIPLDFAGTWRVNADGRWVGTWELGIGDNGTIFGRYTSTTTKSTFPIRGRVTATQLRHRLRFEVEFAAASQEYDMYLWTTDKSTMAGTTTLINRKFGVVAERETKPQPAGKGKPKEKAPERQSAIERLKKKVGTFTVNQVPLKRALDLHAATIGVPIEIRETALKAAGIRPDEPITFSLAGKPGDEVLRAVLKKANPAGELVYVLTRGGGERLAITTRTAAYARGERLPRALWQPLAQRLKRSITLQIKRRRPAAEVFEQLTRQAGIDLLIRFDDLPPEEIDRPRVLTVDAKNQPAGELLRNLLKQTYGEDSEVVYLIANVDGEEYLVLTSRKAAAARGEKLPD